MNILGLTYLSHDSGAAIISNSDLLAAVEEERFNRVKHSADFPRKSIEYCLKTASISINNLDYLVLPLRPFTAMHHRLWYSLRIFPRTMGFLWHNLYSSAWAYKMGVMDVPKKMGLPKSCKLISVEHHIAHASFFFASPFEEAAILTTDGRGEWPCLLFGYGVRNKIRVLKRIYFPHSLGQIYQAVTEYLGFPDYGDEYKVMGLSGYGDASYIELMRELISFSAGKLTINQKFMNYHIFNINMEDRFSSNLDKYLKCRRYRGQEITKQHMDVAASLQQRINEVGLEIAQYLRQTTGSKNLCISGGVALNGVMNNHIRNKSGFENVYIPPAPNDSGLALGGALYVNHVTLNKPRKFVMEHPFWGPEYTDDDIKNTLDTYQIQYTLLEVPALKAAQLIASGSVLAWFQGRAEYGPRALGNRSILADPRERNMKDIINSKIKFREGFRPFAPAVLSEHAAEYFAISNTPFMLFVGGVREDKKHIIPAVTHIDGTARVQTVGKGFNTLFRSLITHFKSITGVPLVINTSFNVKGEPIVCSPDDAIKCFYTSGIDDLILGKYHLSKRSL